MKKEKINKNIVEDEFADDMIKHGFLTKEQQKKLEEIKKVLEPILEEPNLTDK